MGALKFFYLHFFHKKRIQVVVCRKRTVGSTFVCNSSQDGQCYGFNFSNFSGNLYDVFWKYDDVNLFSANFADLSSAESSRKRQKRQKMVKSDLELLRATDISNRMKPLLAKRSKCEKELRKKGASLVLQNPVNIVVAGLEIF